MKLSAALGCSLAIVLSLNDNAQTAAPAEKTSAAENGKNTKVLAAAAAKAADPKTKKEEPPAKIEGLVIPRGKNFLGLQLVDGTFKLSFYDEKKKLVAPDVARALLRWDPKNKIGKERVVLNMSEGGKALSSPKTIRPPYTFKLFITLLKDANEAEDPAGESFVVDFYQ